MSPEAEHGGIFARFANVSGSRGGSAALFENGAVATYSQLLARSAAIGACLPTACRGRSLRVGILLPNCGDYAACFLATAARGGMAVLLNPRMSAGELAWYGREVEPDILFTDETLFSALVAGVPDLAERTVVVGDVPPVSDFGGVVGTPEEISSDTPALCIGTSGTSGVPRLVIRTHGGLIANTTAIAGALGIDAGDRFLSVVPFCHAYGLSSCMLLPLLTGGTMVPLAGFIPDELATACRMLKITVMPASPFIFSMLDQSSASARDFATVRICLSSGARLDPGLSERCRKNLGLEVRQLYGSSETGTLAVSRAADSMDPDCVGSPLFGVEVRIDNTASKFSALCGIGEIIVRSPAMMAGYLDGPSPEQGMVDDGFFRTGDLGRLDEEGRLYVEGRIRRMINVCGIKVDPVEIEHVLREMPGVRQVRVSGQPGKLGMETIAASLSLEKGFSPGRTDVVRFCRGRLAEFKIPRTIDFFGGDLPDPLGKRKSETGSKT